MNDDKELFQHDWYQILGLQIGVSIDEINRAARKLSVKYHPDKTTDVAATDKFLLIQKAKDILSDESKKKIIDERASRQKKRQEYETQRNQEMDSRRKRFRDDLEKRVNEASTKVKQMEESSKEAIPPNFKKSKLFQEKKEMSEEYIRKSREEMFRSEQEKQNNYRYYQEQLAKSFQPSTQSKIEQKGKDIKVKWRKSISDMSEEILQAIFAPCGIIESISISKSKKHSHSANISFSNPAAARKAVEDFASSNDYRVSLVDDFQNLDEDVDDIEKRKEIEGRRNLEKKIVNIDYNWLFDAGLSRENDRGRKETLTEKKKRIYQCLDTIESKLRDIDSISITELFSNPDHHPPNQQPILT